MKYTQYDNNDMYKMNLFYDFIKITAFCGKRLGAKNYEFACKKTLACAKNDNY